MSITIQAQPRFYTPEEYFAQEETAEFRSEYRDGKILPMTGGSIDHNQIVVNLCTLDLLHEYWIAP